MGVVGSIVPDRACSAGRDAPFSVLLRFNALPKRFVASAEIITPKLALSALARCLTCASPALVFVLRKSVVDFLSTSSF